MPEEEIVDYVDEFLRLLKIEGTFDDKVAEVELDAHRGKLPDDFYSVVQVRTAPSENHPPIYFRSTTDSFYKSDDDRGKPSFTYKIQGKIIFCSPMRDGKIEVAYKALELDDCGLPVIPDNAHFERALEWYIKVKKFTMFFEEGKLDPRILQNAQQEYAFAVKACESAFNIPTLDEAKSISNMINSHFPRRFTHYRGRSNSGSEEIYFKH